MMRSVRAGSEPGRGDADVKIAEIRQNQCRNNLTPDRRQPHRRRRGTSADRRAAADSDQGAKHREGSATAVRRGLRVFGRERSGSAC